MEQFQGLFQADGIHALVGQQAGKLRILPVIPGADLNERPIASHAHRHRPPGGRIIAQAARAYRFTAAYSTLLVLHPRRERFPELPHQRDPLLLAPGNGIEFIFQPGGEIIIDITVEMLGQEPVYDSPHVSGNKALLDHLHVFAGAQGGNDGGISRRPADTVFLQGLDQGRLGITRRRFGKMLFGPYFQQSRRITRLHGRQFPLSGIIPLPRFAIIFSFGIENHETLFNHGSAVGPHQRTAAAFQVHCDRIDDGLGHLAGQRPLPDQLVQPELFPGQFRADFLGHALHGSRPDRLVRLLGVFRPGPVPARVFGQVLCAVLFVYVPAHFIDCIRCQVHRVGPHVGDQADRA